MKHDNVPASSHESPVRLTAAGRFVASVAMTGLVATPIGLLASHENNSAGRQASHETAIDTDPITTRFTGSTVLGGAETDWGHTSTEGLTTYLVSEGLAQAYDERGESKDPGEIAGMVGDIALYEPVTKALQQATNDTAPDAHDEIKLTVDVTLNPDDTFAYEITDATLIDHHNNQQ